MTASPLPTTDFAPWRTAIPGLLVYTINQLEDERGYFQEKFNHAKLVAAGMPQNFQVMQTSVSYNVLPGVTRGFHAEPWDKYVTTVKGRAFCAYVDLRQGASFGSVVTVEVTPETAVFVPQGVANSFQTLERDTFYLYSVSGLWSANSYEQYCFVNLADPTIGVCWPIALDEAIVSDRDRAHPLLHDVGAGRTPGVRGLVAPGGIHPKTPVEDVS